MLVNLDFSTDIRRVTRRLRGAQRKQIPFAIASALTKTAQDVVREEQRQLPMKLDRPTSFTRRGFAIRRATKTRQVATVYVKPIQAAYLKRQVHGGIRRPRGRALPVPGGVELNKYGNMKRYQIDALLSDPDVFSGKVRGHAGLWRRRDDGGVDLLVAWEPKAEYSRRFPFYKIARGKARAVFPRNLRRAIEQALRTAK